MNYSIIIYSNKFYKEIPLENKTSLSIGNTKECQLRFGKDRFFEKFRLDVLKQEDKYILTVSGNIDMSTDKTIKEKVHFLNVGDRIAVNYEDSGIAFLYVEFAYDFGIHSKDYNMKINVPRQGQFLMGSMSGCEIIINDPVIGKSYLSVTSVETERGCEYKLDISHAPFAVSVNGFPVRADNAIFTENSFLSVYGHDFYFRDGAWYVSDDGKVTTSFDCQHIKQSNNELQYPKFVRNFRLQYKVPSDKLEIKDPQEKGDKDDKELFWTILPMLSSLCIMVGLRSFVFKGGAKFALYMGAMMGVSIVMTIINFFRSKKKQHRKDVERYEKYEEYMDRKEKEVQEARQQEKEILTIMNPSVTEAVDRIRDFDAHLFEKDRDQDDFLNIRIGVGRVESQRQVTFKDRDYIELNDPLMEYPEKAHDKYQYIEENPVTVNLKEISGLGIVGNRQGLRNILYNLIIAISAQHFFNQVHMFLIIKQEDIADFNWTRWIPHMTDDESGIRYISYDEDTRKRLLQYLYSELSARKNDKNSNKVVRVHLIVFVYRSDEINGHPVTELAEDAKDLDCTFVFLDEYPEQIHYAINKVIFLKDGDNKGTLQDVESAEIVQEFKYPVLSLKQVSDAAIKLAPVYVEEINIDSSLPKNMSLFSLLKVMSAYDLDLDNRWSSSDITKSMAAPIGVTADGSVLSLDIHEKAHGPHGLVAGTTGSGKSELLQTFVLSLATLFHPYELSFVIIDFKGGGMANQFRDLPHLNGAITNIDGKQIDRSLKSIKAELMKRQRLFAQFDVNRIDDYIKLFKAGTAKVPLPHLILIVDEFAELKTDQPEFMKELISTARIGRSLGVHMILATQKPAGVVNDQIWSNSKFKLCLKVQDASDSKEVLKSPLAADIKEPGRAYLEVGNNEIFLLFQSAYSGAPATMLGVDEQKEFELRAVGLAGQRQIIYHQEKKKQEEADTQMDAIVAHIHEYCEKKQIAKMSPICLPPIENKIPFTLEGFEKSESDICIPLGIYDDPDNQVQKATELNLTMNNTLVAGASRSGKTSLLQLIIRSVCELYTPQDVNIYIIDFASMILKKFEKLKFVAGVITPRDDDMLKTFVKMINEEVEKRKKILAESGYGSYSIYRQSGHRDLPQIILMIDNFGNLKELYEKYVDVFLMLFRDGNSVGITVVTTVTQASRIGYKYIANFGQMLAYHCASSAEYSSLFEKCKMEPDDTPGRFLISIDRTIYEGQTYEAFDAEDDSKRIEIIDEYIESVNERFKDSKIRRIPIMPNVVGRAYFDEIGYQAKAPYEIPVGVDYLTTSLKSIDLMEYDFLGMLGVKEHGLYDMEDYIISTLLERRKEHPVEIRILDRIDRHFEWTKKYEDNVLYTLNPGNAPFFVKDIEQVMAERYNNKLAGKNVEDEHGMMVLFINNQDCYSAIDNNAEASQMFARLTNKYRQMGLCIIMGQLPNTGLSYGAAQCIKNARDALRFFMFCNLDEQRNLDFSMSVTREFSKALTTNEGYYVEGSHITKLRTVKPDQLGDEDENDIIA